MKVTINHDVEKFRPFNVTMTIESQADADAIYALFCTVRTVDAVRKAFGVNLPHDAVCGFRYSDDACDKLTSALR